MQTVAEVPEFIRRARRLLSERERESLIDFLALRPKAGVLIRGTGGLRKLRWARRKERGSSGHLLLLRREHSAVSAGDFRQGREIGSLSEREARAGKARSADRPILEGAAS